MQIEQRSDGYFYVNYAEGKRPLKLTPYVLRNDMYKFVFRGIIEFVEAAANSPVHLSKMEPPKFFALVERLATLVCKEISPTKNHGITKPEIRGAVYFVLQSAIKDGGWPAYYHIYSDSFVQYLPEEVYSE